MTAAPDRHWRAGTAPDVTVEVIHHKARANSQGVIEDAQQAPLTR